KKIIGKLPEPNPAWEPQTKDLTWLEQGLSSITSSTDMRTALTSHLTRDKDKLLMLTRVSKKIVSSYDKAAFLTAAAPWMLPQRDDALDKAWFEAVNTINSFYDRSNVLKAAIVFAYGNPKLRDRIAEAATLL